MSKSLDAEEVHRFLKELADADSFSGAVLIAKDGETLFKRAYGLASKRYTVPNTIDTIFNIGSINKIFTKLAIIQLYEQEKLSPKDKVGKFLPDFPKEIAEKITVEQLVTFTSGMGDYFNEKFQDAIGRLRKLDDFVSLFIDDPLSFEPGEGQQYSNAGFVVLGKIIEAISGMDYYDYIRKHIYKPAGMTCSDHFELDQPEPNVATGYTRFGMCSDSCEKVRDTRIENTYLIGTKGSSAGGGYSTLDDFVRFDSALREHKLLSPELTDIVMTPGINRDGKKAPGFVIAGGAPGLSTYFGRKYEPDVIVIVMSNYDSEDTEPVFDRIWKTVTE